MTTTGLSTGRAILRGETERIALDQARLRIPDPPVGEARDGVPPGKWGSGEDGEPQAGEMHPDCPVRVLGLNGDDLYCVDAAGQLSTIGASQFGQGMIERLFGDRISFVYWAWPRFAKAKKGEPPKVDTFRAEKVRQALWAEAHRRGLFTQLEVIRGRGVWPGPGGKGLIVHCGDYLYVNGKMRHVGEVDGFIYPRMQPILHPFHEAVDEQPALEIMRFLQTCSFARPKVDAFLMLGFMGSSFLCGVLRKRPTIFLTGDKGRGKTTVQDYFKLLLGKWLLQTSNTTPAGIYQIVGHDARPVAIDELEAGASVDKVERIMELCRIGYDGAKMLRGGSDHNPVEFESRSSFLCSGINPPPGSPAELSRMALISLTRPEEGRTGSPPVIREADMVGSRLFRRLIDRWSEFDRLFEQYSEALTAGGHVQRGHDTYGTLLACAHLMLGDEGLDALGYPLAHEFSYWSEALATLSLPEYEFAEENWLQALNIILMKNIDAWRGGAHLSVGGLIEALERDDIDFKKANAMLANVSMKLVDGPRRADGRRSLVLAIPNSSPMVAKLFEGTTWQAGKSGHGVWALALRDAPAGVIVQMGDNRVTVNRVGIRCTFVDLDALDAATGRKRAAARPADDLEGF